MYASFTANYDNFVRVTLTFVLFIWDLHWASSQVIVVTEKHQTIDFPEMRPTFTVAETTIIADMNSKKLVKYPF